MQITRELGKYQVVAHTFFQANVAATQSEVALKEATNQNTGLTMPFSGEVIAVTATLSAAATAGTATVSATIGGTIDTDTSCAVTTQTGKSTIVPRDKATFVAGDVLGVKITTSGTWDATTADLTVTVLVALALDGI